MVQIFYYFYFYLELIYCVLYQSFKHLIMIAIAYARAIIK